MIRSRVLGIGLAMALGGLAGAGSAPPAAIAGNASADVQRTAVFELFGRDT